MKLLVLPSPSIEHANSSFSILFNDSLRQNDDTALFIRDQYKTSFCESMILMLSPKIGIKIGIKD